MTDNKSVLKWLQEMRDLLNPDEVMFIDGSESQLDRLRKQACETGEIIKLNQEKLPGCYLHRTAVFYGANWVFVIQDRNRSNGFYLCSFKYVYYDKSWSGSF